MALNTGTRAACDPLEFPPKLITIRRHRQLSSVCALERAAFEAGSGALNGSPEWAPQPERRPRSPQLEKRPHSEEDPAQPKRKYPVKEETLLDKWLHLDLDLDCIEI